MNDSPLHTIKRSLDDPKFQIGDAVPLKDGEVGVVVARYKPSGHANEIRYLVRVEAEEQRKRKP